MHERSIFAPIWQLAFLNGQGKRVGKSALGLIQGHAYSAPYEDVTIKKRLQDEQQGVTACARSTRP